MIPDSAEKIPNKVAGTPVRVLKTESKLPCPHEGCDFHYWSNRGRWGVVQRPTVQDKHSAHDEPCAHFHCKWTPASGEPLETVLKDAAEAASKIFCVMDKQVTSAEDAQLIVIFVEQQATLNGF